MQEISPGAESDYLISELRDRLPLTRSEEMSMDHHLLETCELSSSVLAVPTILAIGLIAIATCAGCRDVAGPADEAAVKKEAEEAGDGDSAVLWSYSGDTGPEHWGSLSGEFETCDTGTEQSPVDISDPTPEAEGELIFEYVPAPLEIVNNGHTIQVNYEAGSAVVIDGRRYELVQFHFHAPSEHTRDGEHSAMEMHLVHEDAAAGDLAVVGAWIEPGDAATPGLAPVWEHLPAQEGPPAKIDGVEVDAAALLPEDRSSFRYPGSLTTPPCTQGVSWVMLRAPINLSEDQIEAFRAIIDGNNRPVQPLNDRTIVAVNEAG